jgi:hypothetical protein
VSVLTDDVAVLTAAVAAFVPAKIAATGQMVAMRDKAAAGQPITLADVAALITLFNAVTEPSNVLRAAAAKVAADSAAVTIGIANMTDAQVTTLDENPVQYFCAGYLCVVNSLLRYDQSQALGIVPLIAADLTQDINDAWADFAAGVTPDPPRPAVIYDSTNALNAVIAAMTPT